MSIPQVDVHDGGGVSLTSAEGLSVQQKYQSLATHRRRRTKLASRPWCEFLPFLILWTLSNWCFEITSRSFCAWAFQSIDWQRYSPRLKAPRGSFIEPPVTSITEDADKNNTSWIDSQEENAWDAMARHIAICLQKTDLAPKKELSGFEGTSTGWAQWIDEQSAMELQTNILDRLELELTASNTKSPATALVRPWFKWMQSNPVPYVYDISLPLRNAVENEILRNPIDLDLQLKRGNLTDLLDRVSCRLVSLPSGQTLSHPLDTPVGTMVYGKVLSGGVERFRLLGSNPQRLRKIGQRTQVANTQRDDNPSNEKDKKGNLNPCWLQYGGSKRSYQALDMGPCLVFELALQPSKNELAMLGASTVPDRDGLKDPMAAVMRDYTEMCSLVQSEDGSFASVLGDLFVLAPNVTLHQGNETKTIHTAEALDTNEMRSNLHASLGGLRPQINEIVRRVLDGRTFVPYEGESEHAEDGDATSRTSAAIIKRQRAEMTTLLELGIKPTKGLLLFGPPGCGKTLLARELSRMIKARPPKIVAAPDLLDRWVGGTEKLVRELFADAEAELLSCQNDPTLSSLHVVVVDECDALFRIRSSSDAASEVTRASAVNQILSKLDGVHPLDNVLLVAMTNRRELIDPALLRPGRLEVQIECPLPDSQGRREILQIQLNGLRQANRLSQRVLESVYGDALSSSSATRSGRLKGFLHDLRSRLRSTPSDAALSYDRPVDLASDEYTAGFSGADLAGLVRNAGSLAVARWRRQEHGSDDMSTFGRESRSVLDGLMITMSDFMEALEDLRNSRI